MIKYSKPKRSDRILLDHKQVGKKFIPPMLTIGVFKEVRWIEIILPELLWIALLNDKYGLRMGAELSLAVAQSAIEVITDVITPAIKYMGFMTHRPRRDVRSIF
jgi:hypothetical protein